MDNDQLKILLKKYELGECTREEIALIESWYNAESAVKPDKVSMEHLSKANANIWGKVLAHTDLPEMVTAKTDDVDTDRSKTSIHLWPRLIGIAAAVAAITLCVWLYYASNLNGRHPEFISGSPLANDIAPGKNTATLTLANGKTINLSDAKTGVIIDADKLSYNDGASVISDPSLLSGQVAREDLLNSTNKRSLPYGRDDDRIQMLTATTPRGGMYQVVLPDGTKLWLNADSKISFPSQFIGKQRKILLLHGEVYFEVAKNKEKPFIVAIKNQEVEVLGTHFNINAYYQEPGIKTTLLEGSVKVRALPPQLIANPNDKNWQKAVKVETILKPGEQALLKGIAQLSAYKVDVNQAVAWKNGYFQFEDADVDQVLTQLARWYDVEVVYEGQVPDKQFSGKIYRNLTAQEALRGLKFTGLNFKIEGKKIIVQQ